MYKKINENKDNVQKQATSTELLAFQPEIVYNIRTQKFMEKDFIHKEKIKSTKTIKTQSTDLSQHIIQPQFFYRTFC